MALVSLTRTWPQLFVLNKQQRKTSNKMKGGAIMQGSILAIGSYGIGTGSLLGSFEDECVGSPPAFSEGIVVSRFEGERVYIRDWHINSHFTGEQALEHFEEAKNNQDFDFTFSSEREIQEGEILDGDDPILQKQLKSKLEELASK